MRKYPKALLPLLASLLLIGCATSDERNATISRVVVNTALVTGAVLLGASASEKCQESHNGAADEACLNRMSNFPTTKNTVFQPALKPTPKAKFDDLETYKAKRAAELEKGE